MMWNRYGLPAAVIGLGLAATVVSAEVAFAQRSRDYTPSEFRALLRGFGYNVTPGNTLRDEATRTAIRQFQQGYKLQVDGIAGPRTQNFAANIMKILKSNLNLVLKPSPGLPVNQFYDSQTEAAVKRFQEQVNLLTYKFGSDSTKRQERFWVSQHRLQHRLRPQPQRRLPPQLPLLERYPKQHRPVHRPPRHLVHHLLRHPLRYPVHHPRQVPLRHANVLALKVWLLHGLACSGSGLPFGSGKIGRGW
jgi:hypothetical protein